MSKVLKRVLLALAVLILVAAICVCVSVAFINRSPDGGNNSGSTDSGNTDNPGGGSDNPDGGNNNPDGGNNNPGGGSDNPGGDKDKYDGLFAGTSTSYALTSDYTLTEADVKATLSSGGGITLGYLCTFNLGGHKLDLGGYTLKISTSSDKVVKFENGKITNGKLDISIPNGDIEFTDTEIDKTVTYELEAASETIRFSNAVIGGKCTVKSNTRVSVEYSNISDLSFTGNGTLTAGRGADLGTVTVDGAGAKLNIADTASVDDVKINAPATVQVDGEVTKLVLGDKAGGSTVRLNDGSKIGTVAVKSGSTQIIGDDGANVMNVVVDSGVAGSLTTTGVTAKPVSSADMEKYVSHNHELKFDASKSKDATCTAAGNKYYACAGCGETLNEVLPALGHKFVLTTQTPPTSTSNGLYSYKCDNCGDVNNVTLDKADAKYYKSDIIMTFADEENEKYETLRLKYYEENNEEYYLLVKKELTVSGDSCEEVAYSVRLKSNTGLPEVKPTSAKYCGDWLKLSFTHNATAEGKKTIIDGNEVRLTSEGYVVFGGVKGVSTSLNASSVNFSGYCFFNEKNNEFTSEEVHDYTATGKLLNNNTYCSQGISVTLKCSKCGHTETEEVKGHYYAGESKKITTQCHSKEDAFYNRECVACHQRDLSCHLDGDIHELSYVYKAIVTDSDYATITDKTEYIKIGDLKTLGFSTDGFFYGNYCIEHCAVCGINVHLYNYYTHTAKDGCLYHTAYIAEYNGNIDYAAFKYSGEYSYEKHYMHYSDEENLSVATATAEIKSYGPNNVKDDEIIFTPQKASAHNRECMGCGLKTERYINLYPDASNTDESFNFRVSYKNNGTDVNSWSYTYGYGFDTAVARAKSFGLDVDFADKKFGYEGYISRSSSATEQSENITLRGKMSTNPVFGENEYDVEMIISRRGNDSLYVDTYRIYECKEYFDYYNYLNGAWVKDDAISYDMPRHDRRIVVGENCRENGNTCAVCNGDGRDFHVNQTGGWSGGMPDGYLTTSNLGNFNGSYYSDRFCQDCNTLINVTIVLNANWTLAEDVFFVAEGITIDLNGYTIDLNGYSLVVYSYCGEKLVITDSRFDTSSVPSVNTQTAQSKITNSGSGGTLALFNKASLYDPVMHETSGNITVGTIVIDENVNMIADDDTGRGDIYSKLLSEGYDVTVVNRFHGKYSY